MGCESDDGKVDANNNSDDAESEREEEAEDEESERRDKVPGEPFALGQVVAAQHAQDNYSQ